MLGAFFFLNYSVMEEPRKVQVLFIRLKKGEMFTYQKAKVQFMSKLHTKLSSNTRAIYFNTCIMKKKRAQFFTRKSFNQFERNSC